MTADRDSTMPAACVFCGSDETELREHDERVVFDSILNVKTATIRVPVEFCRDCGNASTKPEAEEIRDGAIERIRREQIAAEIRTLRDQSGLSRNAWLDLTRIGDATLTRWETMVGEPNPALVQYLFLLSDRDNVQHLTRKALEHAAKSTALHQTANTEEVERMAVDEAIAAMFPDAQFDGMTISKSQEFNPVPNLERAAA